MASTRQTFKVEGLKELEEALGEFSKATSGNILKRSVAAPAAMIAEKASDKAPKRKGRLKKNILVSKPKIITPGKAAFAAAMKDGSTRAEAAAAARAANREAGGTGRSAITHVGPGKGVGQGILQEFGTAHHRAQPFMRPTWDEHGPKAIEMMAETLKIEIDKTAARAAKKAAKLASK